MEERIKREQAYIHQCQLRSGTFRLSPNSNVINPYFTNVALLALVELGDCEPVKQHILWYLQHLSPDGYVNDFRYIRNEERNSGAADSEDSYHATFFSLLLAYIKQTEEIDWLVALHDPLAKILSSLLHLQRSDGLTWAKRSYRVKYLMDNCEVYQGLVDAGVLFSLMGDNERSKLAFERSQASKAGIYNTYHHQSQSFAIYDSVYPKWTKWYPDVTSQAFPIIYPLIEPTHPVAQSLYQRITASFPRFEYFETGDFYPWMVMGMCAMQMNDLPRVQRMLAAAEKMYIKGPRRDYWLLHESGRFIRLARCLSEQTFL